MSMPSRSVQPLSRFGAIETRSVSFLLLGRVQGLVGAWMDGDVSSVGRANDVDEGGGARTRLER